jgi:opacity protein-like surface antigen
MTQRLTAAALASALLVLALPAAARAQNPTAGMDRPIQIGFGGGVILPREGASFRELKNGTQGQGFILVRLPAGLPPLRFNVDYAKMKFERATTPRPGNPGTALLDTAAAERTTVAGIAGVRLDLLRGPVRPYVLAGVGAFNVKDAIEQSSGTRDFSDVNFGVDGGAGLAIKLGPISAFAEARLQNVYTKQQGLIDTKSIKNLPVTFGLSF